MWDTADPTIPVSRVQAHALAVTLTGTNGKTTTVSTGKALTLEPAKAKANKRR